MPEDGTKPLGTELLHPRRQHLKSLSFALPLPTRQLADTAFQRRRLGERRPFWQPFADTGRPDPAGDDPHGDLEFFRDGIGKGWLETPLATTGSRLRIVRQLPFFPIECRDQSSGGLLFFRPVIRGVRLSRNHKHFTHSNVLHGHFIQDGGISSRLPATHLELVPSARAQLHAAAKLPIRDLRSAGDDRPLRWLAPRSRDDLRFDLNQSRLSRHGARHFDLSPTLRVPLGDLPIRGRLENASPREHLGEEPREDEGDLQE